MVAKPSTKTFIENDNQLKDLWIKLDHYRIIKAECHEDSRILKEYIEDGVYDFFGRSKLRI